MVGITSEEERNRVRSRQMIRCDDPYREQPEKKKLKGYCCSILLFISTSYFLTA